MPSINWQLLAFRDLSTAQLYKILAARSRVFVCEQNCAYLDPDGYDDKAQHLCGWSAVGNGLLAAYCRIFAPGIKYPECSFGRVLTDADFRGTGLARECMSRAMSTLQKQYPHSGIRISAQVYLQDFYESLGFVCVRGPYDEDGIPHFEMLRSPA
jgi:ElaA protein